VDVLDRRQGGSAGGGAACEAGNGGAFESAAAGGAHRQVPVEKARGLLIRWRSNSGRIIVGEGRAMTGYAGSDPGGVP